MSICSAMSDLAGPDVPPSLDDIAQMAQQAVASLPDAFAQAARSVVLRVADFADEATLQDMDIEDPFALTGLYDGIPLTEKSVMDVPSQPDTIWLFRRPIFDERCAREDVGLTDLVGHVMVHELAYHFGWSDEEITKIDRWWE